MAKNNLLGIVLAALLLLALPFVFSQETGSYSNSIDYEEDGNGDIEFVASPSGGNPNPYCGDGSINTPSEYCDGSDLAAQTCASYLANPEATGSLSCTSSCTFDTSGCSIPTNSNTVSSGSSGGGGGGGGGSIGSSRNSGSALCLEDWICTEWDSCSNGIQERSCTQRNTNCNTTNLKPVESRICTVEGASGEDGIAGNQSNGGFFNWFTGNVIGGGAKVWVPLIILLALIIGAIWFIAAKKPAKKK